MEVDTIAIAVFRAWYFLNCLVCPLADKECGNIGIKVLPPVALFVLFLFSTGLNI